MADEKKIADEVMSDEELDQVAGGNIATTSDDSIFLYKRGLVNDWHGDFHMISHWNSDSKAVDAGWAKAGITCVTKPGGDNQYFIGDMEISREEALDMVSAKFPKIRSLD